MGFSTWSDKSCEFLKEEERYRFFEVFGNGERMFWFYIIALIHTEI